MKKTSHLTLALAACAALAGCGSVPTGRFDNVITVSLTGDRAFVSSLYGPLGVTAELRESDARELRRLRELQPKAASAPAR